MNCRFNLGDEVFLRQTRMNGKPEVVRARIIGAGLDGDDELYYTVRVSLNGNNEYYEHSYTYDYPVRDSEVYATQEEALDSIRFAKVDEIAKYIKDAGLSKEMLTALIDRIGRLF